MNLSITMFLTIDGVYQSPGAPEEDPSNGFTHGGWLVPHFDEQFGAFMDRAFEDADAFLLGRRTYEIFAGYWPDQNDPDDPVGTKLNALPKHVASTTLTDPQWSGTQVIQGDVVGAVRTLKAQHGRELQVHGSGALAQTLIAADLVDTYRFVRVPAILGEGKRLFPENATPKGLTLRSSETTSTGVVLEVYDAAGPPQTGVFGADA